MSTEKAVALALPDEAQFRRDIQAINRFQQVVHQTMVRGLDYGVIPGTGNKPTLLKPGAEKIAKLLGLADQYEIIDRQEDWKAGFFRYLVRCKLTHIATGSIVSEGLGECNSMESKYHWRWVFPDDVPSGIDHTKLVKRVGKRKDGKGTYTQYRLENEDIYSQVNTILKMGKKRALVDAALSAGRLSDIFTQDIEDIGEIPSAVSEQTPEVQPEATPLVSASGKQQPEASEEKEGSDDLAGRIDPVWLKETLEIINWHRSDYKTARSWISFQLKAPVEGTIAEVVDSLDDKQLKIFSDHIGAMRESAGR